MGFAGHQRQVGAGQPAHEVLRHHRWSNLILAALDDSYMSSNFRQPVVPTRLQQGCLAHNLVRTLPESLIDYVREIFSFGRVEQKVMIGFRSNSAQ
jgi:hypothetical protein